MPLVYLLIDFVLFLWLQVATANLIRNQTEDNSKNVEQMKRIFYAFGAFAELFVLSTSVLFLFALVRIRSIIRKYRLKINMVA